MIMLHKIAARAGIASAQFRLGVAYYHGRGVRQDFAEAVKWYRQAAEQGYANAQFTLGGAYALGLGVRQSDVLALMWMNLAAKNCSTEQRQKVLATKAIISAKVTLVQAAEADRLAEQWRTTK